MTTHLQLPFSFDEKKLQADLAILLKSEWIPHFNQGGYKGQWNSIALYAAGGNAHNIFALNNTEAEVTPTPMLEQCPYLQSVIEHFECPLIAVRLLRLSVGAYIKPHRDFELGYENDNFRLHIPIITNPEVRFILDGNRLEMKPGECWYTNVNFVHSVANNGTVDRVHLVIDGVRNEWSDRLFYSLATKESFVPPSTQNYSSETRSRMIEELKRMEGVDASELIASLKSK